MFRNESVDLISIILSLETTDYSTNILHNAIFKWLQQFPESKVGIKTSCPKTYCPQNHLPPSQLTYIFPLRGDALVVDIIGVSIAVEHTISTTTIPDDLITVDQSAFRPLHNVPHIRSLMHGLTMSLTNYSPVYVFLI